MTLPQPAPDSERRPSDRRPSVRRPIDSDGHYYEPYDAFTRHIEAKYRTRAVNVRVSEHDGLGRLYYGDQKAGLIRVVQCDYTGAPGSRAGAFLGIHDDEDPGGWSQPEMISAHDFPAMMHRANRLALLDEQGLDGTLLFPSLGVSVEHELHDDTEVLYANLRSFNRWLEDDWGFGEDERLFAAPMISLVDVDRAIAETERVLAAGARLLHLRLGPIYGESAADPKRDRFWALVQEADIPVSFHVSDAGYHELWGAQWGELPRPPLQYQSPFNNYLAGTSAQDTFANLILNNLFVRFPRLKVLSIENGASWVKPLMKRLDKVAFMTRGQAGVGGPIEGRPSETFQRNFYVCPFFEEDPVELAEAIGYDHVLFGSDWPHPEGLEQPLGFAEKLVHRANPSQTASVMRDNIAGLIGVGG
jgi:predicted TIM-barrel fold metal-dependent hydrolase